MWEQRFIFIYLFIYLFLINIFKFFFFLHNVFGHISPSHRPSQIFPTSILTQFYSLFVSLFQKQKQTNKQAPRQPPPRSTKPNNMKQKVHEKKSINLFWVGQVFLGMWSALEYGWNVQWHSIVKKNKNKNMIFPLIIHILVFCGYMHMSGQKTVSGPLLLN